MEAQSQAESNDRYRRGVFSVTLPCDSAGPILGHEGTDLSVHVLPCKYRDRRRDEPFSSHRRLLVSHGPVWNTQPEKAVARGAQISRNQAVALQEESHLRTIC